jgi:hypothetical protein
MDRRPSLALLFISAITLFQQPAVADTYQALVPGSDAGVFLYGIDDNKVALQQPVGDFCSPSAVTPCYLTYVNGIDASRSLVPPILLPSMDGPMGPGFATSPSKDAVDPTSHGVPEPGTMVLVGTGLLAAISSRRRLFR